MAFWYGIGVWSVIIIGVWALSFLDDKLIERGHSLFQVIGTAVLAVAVLAVLGNITTWLGSLVEVWLAS